MWIFIRQLFGDYFDGNSTRYCGLFNRMYLYQKIGFWTWINSGLDWSGVNIGLRNRCLTGLVRTSGLNMYTVGLLPHCD